VAIVAVAKSAAVPVTMIILLGFITKHSIFVRSQPHIMQVAKSAKGSKQTAAMSGWKND
jgi:hypothetical protein